MKKLQLLAAALLAACVPAMAGPRLVSMTVTESYPPAENISLEYDAENRLSSVNIVDGDESEVISFLYNEPSNGMVQIKVEEGGMLLTTYNCTLNSGGYISSAKLTEDGETLDVTYEYTEDGQLISMITRKENMAMNKFGASYTWTDGDITSLATMDYDDNYLSVIRGDLTYSEIENAAGLMLYDKCFGIDSEAMEYAYFAGLLGKATKHLPSGGTFQLVESGDVTETHNTSMTWTLDSAGLPTAMTTTTDGESTTYTFTWSSDSGVHDVIAEPGEERVFGIDGMERTLGKGINIIRTADGKTRKVII